MPSKRLKGRHYRAANESKSALEDQVMKSPLQVPLPPKGTHPTRNLIVEVVIPPNLKNSRSKSSSSRAEDLDGEIDDDVVQRRAPRRAKKFKKLVISDDEDEDSVSEYDQTEDSTPINQGSETVDSEEDDMSAIEDDSDASDGARSKAKARPKPKPKPKAKAKGVKKSEKAQSSEDEMDVDEIPSKSQRGKKRKSDVISSDVDEEEEDEKSRKKAKKETKPKVSRATADPWKLKSSSVREDWKQMQAPALEMFHFHRLVIDEYTYLDGKTHSLITNLQATCRWVLSGTPPVHDFPSLKTIAVFLDVHLGIDDDGEGQSAQMKKRRREQTGQYFVSIIV